LREIPNSSHDVKKVEQIKDSPDLLPSLVPKAGKVGRAAAKARFAEVEFLPPKAARLVVVQDDVWKLFSKLAVSEIGQSSKHGSATTNRLLLAASWRPWGWTQALQNITPDQAQFLCMDAVHGKFLACIHSAATVHSGLPIIT
jgi:hypothetical protein